nr:uncharacterized protein LOC109149872 [Ipomoea trifida]
MSLPPANFAAEKSDFVAGQVAHHISQAASGAAELFFQVTVDVSHRDQEIRELKEKVRYLEAQDPIGLQALHQVTAWGYHQGKYVMQESLHRALADGVEDWEQVRALLPDHIPSPGPEPFSDPPVGPIVPHTTNSRSHVP